MNKQIDSKLRGSLFDYVWLVCATRAKIPLSHLETSLKTTRLSSLRRSRRLYGNYQSSQSSWSSQNFRTIIFRPLFKPGFIVNKQQARAAHRFVHFFSGRCFTRLQRETYTINGGNVVLYVSFRFFHSLRLIWWPLAFPIFSPPL